MIVGSCYIDIIDMDLVAVDGVGVLVGEGGSGAWTIVVGVC